MRVSEWLSSDPVTFDETRRQHTLKVKQDVFEILVSKLRANHIEYFRNTLGLNAKIEFKGYDKHVKAVLPYKDKPVEFYKWWLSNQDVVNISLEEKIKLFQTVLMKNPKALKKEHLRLIDKNNSR